MKRAVFEKDFIRVEDSETGTPGTFLKFAFRVQAALYKLRYRFVHVKPQDKKYNVAVCAIFKNEAPYLKEWIEFIWWVWSISISTITIPRMIIRACWRSMCRAVSSH